jgi:hypothetical protein
MPQPVVLSSRALNRALLARQHLLERAPMSPASLIEWLVGIQAQTPQSPYFALWSRLDPFDPRDASRLIERRAAVRLPLLRTTLHLVTAADALALRPVIQPVLTRGYESGSPFHKDLVGLDVDEIVSAGRDVLAAVPVTTAVLGARLAERWPDRPPASLAYAVRYLLPVVQIPPRGLWQRTGQPTWATVESWLGRSLEPATDAATDALVLRYLAAFGPATASDIRTWSWLTGVREVVERLRPRLTTFRDERGRELLDVPGAPLPDPETPAPPRFLPDYDNAILSHDDRSRIVSDELRRRWMSRRGPMPGTVLVDGFAAAVWWIERSGGRASLVIEPPAPLPSSVLPGVLAEAERVLAFVSGSGAGDVRIANDA